MRATLAAVWRGTRPCDKAFAVFWAALFILLLGRLEEGRFSRWSWHDPQLLLSLNQWEKEGWLKNRLLGHFQGYAPFTRLLDSPPLTHHAHGIAPRENGIGPRALYTHYPGGWMVPYAALYHCGLRSTVALQAYSVTVSLAALALLYLTFRVIAGAPVALFAAAFYACNSGFHGFADAISNIPIDDLLRFGFLFAIVAGRERRSWLAAAWTVEFLLSMCSFDSVFFLYVWLIGWDFARRRRLDARKYLLFALAPILAHGLLFLQNVSYLGWGDALADAMSAFSERHAAPGLRARLSAVWEPYVASLRFTHPFLWALPALYCWRRISWGGGKDQLPPIRALIALFLAGCAFPLLLPGAGQFPYQVRQMLPVLSLLFGGLLVCAARDWRASRRVANMDRRSLIFSGLVILATCAFISEDVVEYVDFPGYRAEKTLGVRFALAIRDMQTKYAPVYFDLRAFPAYYDYMPGYPQIAPMVEHYLGDRLVMCFAKPDLLVKDLTEVLTRFDGRFSPIVLTRTSDEMVSTLRALSLAAPGIPRTGLPIQGAIIRGRFVLDLTNVAEAVYWKDARAAPAEPLPGRVAAFGQQLQHKLP